MMTPEAKRSLSDTIRSLRGHLLDKLHSATEQAYKFSLRARDAALSEAAGIRRRRFENWLDEQVRAQARGGGKPRSREDFRRDVEKQAAYTLINRLVFLRLMERMVPDRLPVLTSGWDSRGYRDFRELGQALVRDEETEGYAFLLRLVFEDLAVDLPGLYGPAGMSDLVPIPPATLRHVVEALDHVALESCWTDDMTFGWVYQYWNDPEREALDAKLNARGKLERHEIASKTQMFTERYIVDWLLQNSLGPMWLAMCKKHGWTPHCESKGTLAALEARRVEWRCRRDAGEVELTELMPLHNDDERRWAYYMPQPIPGDAVEHAPESVREIKILDPAVGSGHFLVVAFDLLEQLYREEAMHRGEYGQERWSNRAVIERILEHNLHGIDLDPRAVQIAAASLWLKAELACPGVKPRRLNLVASNLRLGSLPDDDPALVELRREIERETGIPGELTDTVIHALKGADHLGSLLKVDSAVAEAIRQHENASQRSGPEQGGLFDGFAGDRRVLVDVDVARETVMERLAGFLDRHTAGEDLGLHLRGEQLAAGVRFIQLVRENSYDLIVGNPPYQGTSKMVDAEYVQKQYPLGKADLYAAFLERGVELVRTGGTCALLTMRNWMFIKQYEDLRTWLLRTFALRAVGDFAIGAFDEVPNDLLSVAVNILERIKPTNDESIALQPTPQEDLSYDRERTRRKRAATLCHTGAKKFNPSALRVVPGHPLVYWWEAKIIQLYASHPLLEVTTVTRRGATTGNNLRFLRRTQEVSAQGAKYLRYRKAREPSALRGDWVPYIKGARGRQWFDSFTDIVRWASNRLEMALSIEHSFGEGSLAWKICNSPWDEAQGVAYSTIGSAFSARLHRYHSVVDVSGATLVPCGRFSASDLVCRMNSTVIRRLASDLNPSMNFQLADLRRVPFFPVPGAMEIVEVLDTAFCSHEASREPSVEFRRPGPSPWRHSQAWAQAAVDRPEGEPLPAYEPAFESEPYTDHLSFALGVSLGRFGAHGEGILDPKSADLSHTLPAAICFLNGSLDPHDDRDSLGHAAAKPLHDAWKEQGDAVDRKLDLRTWLRLKFFTGVHKGMYENRPIHWPLSSARKTFVAWINIHRWHEGTLRILLADHLIPTLASLEGELLDLRAAREGADKKAARAAERRYAQVFKWRDELRDFIAAVEQCAEKGAPPTDGKCKAREADARYAPDLDDGVMINSAALWPLLDPQWKDPKKWWQQLAGAEGKKDYDWSHLAMRYWPTRVDEKCRDDPSLGVAHGCFWKYHPARAWKWELRLQDEIGPDFRIEEAPYRGDGGHESHRAAYLEREPEGALQAVEKEVLRRRKKHGKPQAEMRLLEAGLWSAVPDLCWQLELRVSKKQEAELRLTAPGEPEARAAFEAAHPDRAAGRAALIASFEPMPDLLAEGGA